MDWPKQSTVSVLLLLGLLNALTAFRQGNLTETRLNKKARSVFDVIRFPNDVCAPNSGGKNGTCYTASECELKKGKATGTCADGYGVCCIFTLGCGGVSSENCTYFDSPATVAAGTCTATICKVNPGICALRIDFANFVISGPSTPGGTDVKILGNLVSPTGVPANVKTQCLTDVFTVSGNGAGGPPPICGTNSNQHIYVDASDTCNQLSFLLGLAGVGTPVATRAWSLKVSQLSCQNPNLPPSGCTQYYYGSTTGTFQSFNFGTAASNLHLANQNQVICIRRERSSCRICYTTLLGGAIDFSLSGQKTSMGFNLPTMCCGYGTKGTGTMGYDCLMIPGATKKTNNAQIKGNSFCGNRFTSVTATSAKTSTICTMQTPFQVAFVSNPYELMTEVGNSGFRLYYSMTC